MILENSKLKQRSLEQTRQISQLQDICNGSPSYTKATSSLKKCKRRKRFSLVQELKVDYSSNDLGLQLGEDDEIGVDGVTSDDSNVRRTSQNTHPTTSSLNQNSKQTEEEMCGNITDNFNRDRPQIFIAGGKQVSGLASKLIQSRVDTKYERKYFVSSIVKPNASSAEILKSCRQLQDSTENYLVLGIGEDDTNPNKLMYELVALLTSMQKTNIIILNVIRNKSLNECMLNSALKNICHNFDSCKYLNIYPGFHNKKHYLLTVCREINLILDSIYYNKKNLNFSKKPKSQNDSTSKNGLGAIKGTIPFYFKSIKKSYVENKVTKPESPNTFFQ